MLIFKLNSSDFSFYRFQRVFRLKFIKILGFTDKEIILSKNSENRLKIGHSKYQLFVIVLAYP